MPAPNAIRYAIKPTTTCDAGAGGEKGRRRRGLSLQLTGSARGRTEGGGCGGAPSAARWERRGKSG
eukprot:6718538-Prymnesium_polylepis.1